METSLAVLPRATAAADGRRLLCDVEPLSRRPCDGGCAARGWSRRVGRRCSCGERGAVTFETPEDAYAAGEAAGIRRSILEVLCARPLWLTPEVRDRVAHCDRIKTLGHWLVRAADAPMAEDTFGPDAAVPRRARADAGGIRTRQRAGTQVPSTST